MPHALASDGARIHYRVHGDEGPTVVLVMGLGGSGNLWMDVPERLVQDRWRVITVDNRGTGRSSAPRGIYPLRRMADEVRRIGLDRITSYNVCYTKLLRPWRKSFPATGSTGCSAMPTARCSRAPGSGNHLSSRNYWRDP